MSRKFVVVVDNLTADENDKITDYFKEKYSWWHWLEGLWLIVDHQDKAEEQEIAEEIQEFLPGKQSFVLQIHGNYGWYVFTREDAHEWLHETWDLSDKTTPT